MIDYIDYFHCMVGLADACEASENCVAHYYYMKMPLFYWLLAAILLLYFVFLPFHLTDQLLVWTIPVVKFAAEFAFPLFPPIIYTDNIK